MGAEARTVRQCACQDSLQSLIMALPGSSSQDQLTLPPPCSVSDEHLQVPSQSSTLCRCPAPASDPGSKSRSGLRSGGGGGWWLRTVWRPCKPAEEGGQAVVVEQQGPC